MSASEISRRGILLVLSSPSGAGKTTITRELVARESPLQISVSATTRPPRKGEIDGKHYHFIARERFDAMVHHGELLEHASVFGHRDIAESVRQVQAILAAERVRRGRLSGLADFVNHLRTGRQA